jgi:hypothetical protein
VPITLFKIKTAGAAFTFYKEPFLKACFPGWICILHIAAK